MSKNTAELFSEILEEALVSSSYQNLAVEDRLRYFKLVRRALLQVFQEACKFFPMTMTELTQANLVTDKNGYLEFQIKNLNKVDRVEYKIGNCFYPLEESTTDAFLNYTPIRGIKTIPQMYALVYTVPLTIWISPSVTSTRQFYVYGRKTINSIIIEEVEDPETKIKSIVFDPNVLEMPNNPNLENYISLKSAYICAILANSVVTEEKKATLIEAKKLLFATTDKIDISPQDMIGDDPRRLRSQQELYVMSGGKW